MPLNDKSCTSCRNYDPIRNGLDKHGNTKYAVRGWCAPKSVYPFKEQEGQVFPTGVTRVKPGELAKPFIVIGDDVQEGCGLYHAKL